jgi:hypothetical protein
MRIIPESSLFNENRNNDLAGLCSSVQSQPGRLQRTVRSPDPTATRTDHRQGRWSVLKLRTNLAKVDVLILDDVGS